MSPSEIEVVPITAAQIGGAFLVFVLLLMLAVGATAWAMRGPTEPEQPTAEVRHRGPGRQPNTGTIHAAHLPVPDDSPTQVIRRPGVQR